MQHPTSSATAPMPNGIAPRSTSPSPFFVKSPARLRRQLQAHRGRRVLLVEENEAQRAALKAELIQSGFQVTVALDDVSAAWSLEFCHYDAVILDLGAPDSQMLEVLTEVGQSKMLPSVMILTGGDESQGNAALTLGVDLVLQKPCTVDDLSNALASLVVG